MGLQCSILGHSFEPAGVEREREEQGSEVVTTEREIERCRRCGNERVVSESTEVTAVVDADAVGLDGETDTAPEDAEKPATDSSVEGGIAGVVDRSDGTDDDVTDAPDSTPPTDVDGSESASSGSDDDLLDDEPRSPEEDDAEILTDDDDADSTRAPGQWPDDVESGDEPTDNVIDLRDEADDVPEEDSPVETPGEESLSGITVPEGEIVCPDCGFRIEARSGYREGDSCPECSTWLEAERNQ